MPQGRRSGIRLTSPRDSCGWAAIAQGVPKSLLPRPAQATDVSGRGAEASVIYDWGKASPRFPPVRDRQSRIGAGMVAVTTASLVEHRRAPAPRAGRVGGQGYEWPPSGFCEVSTSSDVV